MENFKKRLYEVIEVSHEGDDSSKAYDILMTIAVIVGMVPLTLKTDNAYTVVIEVLTALLFSMDYSSGNLLIKFIYIGGIYALIKANSFVRDFIGGVSTEFSQNVNNLFSIFK